MQTTSQPTLVEAGKVEAVRPVMVSSQEDSKPPDGRRPCVPWGEAQ